MNEKTKNFCLKLGEFSASPENGSACYSLPLKLPKGSNDFSPALSLNYCSLPNDTSDGLLGSGWQLQGTPRGRFDGENGLLQNGKKALLTIEKAIISHLSSSGVTTYFEFEDKKEKERLRATKQVDLFGNQILFRYGKEGELSRIDYGCKKTLNRSVQFRYLKEGPWLSSIQTLIAGEEYFSYFLERNGKELQQISSYCPGEKGEPENYGAVAFSYNEDTKGQLLLQTVKDAAGLTVKTNYRDPSGILDQYDLVASRPRGKKVTYTHKIDVNGKPVKAGGRLVYPLVVLQNEGALRGEFFEYETEGDDAGALIKEGEFAISGSDSVQKEYCFTGKEENGKAPYQYPLITEKQYSYTRHPLTDALLLERVSARQFIQPGKALPARKSSYVYSDTGLLTTISDGEKEECFDYLDHPFNSTISHLRSRSIRDLKTWEVLSDTQFSYQFSQKDRQISSISRRSMIEDGLYSNEEVISLGDAGLITEKVNPAGLITQYNYDSFQNPVSETAISKDKKKTLSAHSECHPASGDVLTARSFEGSICQFRYDGFGRRIQIKGFDPSNAVSWKNDTGIVPLCSTAYVYDQSLKTRVEISRRPGKQRGQMLEKRVLFDGMQRPTAEVTELEAGSWLVVSIRYDTAGRECARSIPHRLKTGKNSLAEKLAALDAQDLKWVETEYDAFGREKTITYPDGSRLLLDYRLSGENSVLVQERSVSSDGKNSTVRQQLFSSRGLLLTSALGAQVKDRFDYDGLGRKVRKTDINGNETHYKWNALDFCVSESNSISGILSLKMDQKLQISSEEKNGDCLEHQYDWLGRRTATTSKDGKTYHTVYEEDLLNRSTSVTHIHPEGWSSTHRFSPTGQEIEKAVTLGEENTLSVKSLLNPDGSIASRHYPDGRQLELGYSVEGWISSLGWKGTSPLARFEDHDLYGKPSGTFYANGVTEKSRSDASGNLLTFSVLNRARRPLLFQRYSYGEGYMGMVSALEESRQGRSGEQYRFNYDSSARLTNVSKTDKGLIEHYEFGKADNVIQFEAEQTLFKAQNALNSYQITDYSGAKGADGYLAYSESGDLKSWIAAGEQHEYRYDPFGYVQKSTVGAGKKAKSAEFVREQTGNRLCKITSEGQVYFRLDDDFELSRNTKGEWFATAFLQNENGCVVESTLPFKGFTKNSKFFRKLKAPHKVNTKSLKASDLQEERQAGDIYLHLDIRGSSLLATNMDGKVLASLYFSSRGLIDTKSSSGKISFTPVFAGMQYDADLALYDAGARYYNPKIGIFLSPDPIRDSVDPYAYPADPVNYYDDRGECGRFNWKRRFARNCGRGFTILGWVLTSFFISVLFYVIWDISVFGIDADEALRWGLVVGTWFALAGFLEMSLLQCSGLNRANTNCEILLAETARLVTSTAVGAIILPPMGCFIGTSPETPVPWDPTNCEPHHYMSNLSRGVVVTAASSVIKTVGRLLIKRVKWFDKSVVGKYLSSICINYVGYASWQGLDTLYVHTFMKMSLKEIWAPGKLSFATGEIILGLLLASPNIILAVIPASLCQRFSWNWFATPRLTTEGGDRYLPIWPNGSSEYVDLDADQEAEQSRRRDNYEVLGSGHTDQTIVMTSSPQAQNYGALSHHSEFGEELLDQGDDLQQGSSGDEGGSEEGILELEMINEGELRRQIPSLSPEEEEEDNKTEDKERDDLSDLEKGQGKDEDATD